MVRCASERAEADAPFTYFPARRGRRGEGHIANDVARFCDFCDKLGKICRTRSRSDLRQVFDFGWWAHQGSNLGPAD